MSKVNYIIWGSSGHAKVINDVIQSNGGQVIAFFDKNPLAHSVIPNVPIFIGENGFREWLSKIPSLENFFYCLAIGGARGKDRVELSSFLNSYGLRPASVIHSTASISGSAKLGHGIHILANVVVAAEVCIGDMSILNNSATVDHECNLGNGVHIAPGATLCGCVSVGCNTLIGAGAIVLPRITVGSNVIVGAGSVVTKDIPDKMVVAGNPAKIIRKNYD